MQHVGHYIIITLNMLKTQHETKFTQTCCYTGLTALIKLFYLKFDLKPMRAWLLHSVGMEFHPGSHRALYPHIIQLPMSLAEYIIS